MPTRSRGSRPRLFVALLLPLLWYAAAADARAQQPHAKLDARLLKSPFQALLAQPAAHSGAAVVAPIVESEPNNTAANADPGSLGDEVTGTIDPAADVDMFAITLPANASIDLEVFASREGSQLDSFLELYDATGTTRLAANDDAGSLDSRIRYTVSQAGTYLIVVTDLLDRGGTGFTYRLRISALATGPGDPTTLFVDRLTGAWATAAAPGRLFAIDITPIGTSRIIIIDESGAPAIFAEGIGDLYDITIDGFGRVLAAGQNNQNRGIVTAIDPSTGQRTNFITPIESAVSITVGPDGDVYVANTVASRIHRFDARGVEKGRINIAGTHGELVDLAFSPSGVLHYSNYGNAIFRVVNGQPQRVISANPVGGLAFDRDGNLYVGSGPRGIVLYSADYQLLHDPFAISGFTAVWNVVFGRDAAGAMTRNLYGINFTDGTIRRVNPAGVRAPGLRIGVDLLLFATDTLRSGVMGGEYADTVRVLGATGAVTWSLAAGALPPGLALDPSTGVISGIARQSGSFNFTVRADAAGRVGTREFTVSVVRPVVERGIATDHLLGLPRLSPALQRFLDLQGNNNGRFDIGDLNAYLRSQTTSGGGSR